jgi:hypothetical protein
VIPLLPIELLISWNNLDKLDEFKHVLLSYNFRKTILWLAKLRDSEIIRQCCGFKRMDSH